MRWRDVIIGLLVLFVVIGLVLLAHNASVAVWDGRFPLQVNLVETKDRGIVKVACDTLDDMEYAKYVRTAPERLDLHMKGVDWMEGEPFTCKLAGATQGLEGN